MHSSLPTCWRRHVPLTLNIFHLGEPGMSPKGLDWWPWPLGFRPQGVSCCIQRLAGAPCMPWLAGLVIHQHAGQYSSLWSVEWTITRHSIPQKLFILPLYDQDQDGGVQNWHQLFWWVGKSNLLRTQKSLGRFYFFKTIPVSLLIMNYFSHPGHT